MNFILHEIKQISHGGISMLRNKISAFPSWLLWRLSISRYGSGIVYYSARIIIAIRPGWAEAYALKSEALIGKGRYDDAFSAWEQAFLLKPAWSYSCNRIYCGFIECGQIWAMRRIIQRYLNAQDNFSREHQLDKLGFRFLSKSTNAIGHIALLDYHVKRGILGKGPKTLPILFSAKPANKCYLEYWRSYIPNIITDPLAIKLLSPLEKYLEDHDDMMDLSDKVVIQAQWDSDGREPLLSLSDSDHERGWQCLQTLGVPADAWFVSLHVRDAGIGNSRDSDINTYRMAIESIVARGGWVIRMGDTLMRPLSPIPHVIDYAHSKFRTDWMDVFLWARCRFFIGTQSGPAWVPPTFGVPCVITNWSSMGARPYFSRDLCIFKHHWSENTARYLNFSEVISSALGWSESAGYPASVGIRLMDNNSEEINDVVVEMMDRLDGKLQYSREDDELQERFHSLYSDTDFKSNARVGRDFLRKWAHLL